MGKRYDEVMERIEVTPEMRRRVLDHIRDVDLAEKPAKVISFPRWQKIAAWAACVALLVAAGSFAWQRRVPGKQPDVLVVHDVVDCSSLEALEDRAGFAVGELSALPFPVASTTYQLLWGRTAEVIYEGSGQSVTYRKAAGSEDISGDYDVYAQVETVDGVTVKGDGGLFRLAVWTDETYTYAVAFAQGVEREVLLGCVQGLR